MFNIRIPKWKPSWVVPKNFTEDEKNYLEGLIELHIEQIEHIPAGDDGVEIAKSILSKLKYYE